MRKSLSEYEFNGRPVTAINLLLLISEMEGTYQHLKYMGFEEDMKTIDTMKKRYYSLTSRRRKKKSRLRSSVVEQGFCKAQVAGSNPVRGFVAIMTCLKNK